MACNAYVFAWMVVLAYFSTLGFDVGLLRFVPAYGRKCGHGTDRQRPVRDGGHADRLGAGARLRGPCHAASPPPAIDDILPAYDAAAWRRAAIPLVILGATESLLNRTGVIWLGWITDTEDAGIYSLAFNMALVVTLPRIAMNTLFAPVISDLYARRDTKTMQILITRTSSWTFWTVLCIAAALFVLAKPLLAWFGAGYDAGVPALRILLISQVMAASAGSQLYVMTMTGHERSAAVLLVSCAMVNAGTSAVLVGMFGLTGAAIGTAVSLVVWNVAMALFLWRRLSLLPGLLPIFRIPLECVLTGRGRVM
jgi:O-antigen/teichoic acid export membrane protein